MDNEHADNIAKPKRSMIFRFLMSVLWFVPFTLLITILVGALVGAISSSNLDVSANSFKEGYKIGYETGNKASIEFYQKHGNIVLLSGTGLWLFLSITGILPGTGKFKRVKGKKRRSA